MATIDDVIDKLDDVLDKIADTLEKINEVKTDVNVPKSLQRFCRHCHGTGNKSLPDDEVGTCPDCGGDGLTRVGRITLTTEE